MFRVVSFGITEVEVQVRVIKVEKFSTWNFWKRAILSFFLANTSLNSARLLHFLAAFYWCFYVIIFGAEYTYIIWLSLLIGYYESRNEKIFSLNIDDLIIFEKP